MKFIPSPVPIEDLSLRLDPDCRCLVCAGQMGQADVKAGKAIALMGITCDYIAHIRHFFDVKGRQTDDYKPNLETFMRNFLMSEGYVK